MENEFATLTFELCDVDNEGYREASKIQLTVPVDMDIYEYRTICKRMAAAIGYTQKSIDSAFGDDQFFDTGGGSDLSNLLNSFLSDGYDHEK